VSVCWLASEVIYVVNSLVPVYWLASDLRSVVRELTTYITSDANQQTGTRQLTDLSSEVNQQIGTRELTTYLRSEANQQVVNSLVPICWLASEHLLTVLCQSVG
jgi:hypothetical protein